MNAGGECYREGSRCHQTGGEIEICAAYDRYPQRCLHVLVNRANTPGYQIASDRNRIFYARVPITWTLGDRPRSLLSPLSLRQSHTRATTFRSFFSLRFSISVPRSLSLFAIDRFMKRQLPLSDHSSWFLVEWFQPRVVSSSSRSMREKGGGDW